MFDKPIRTVLNRTAHYYTLVYVEGGCGFLNVKVRVSTSDYGRCTV